ncbi:hypothetical protein IQ06DRAFT_376099 [Phaeosphaeriaceae sp. SRC1lsM3a]|nr:hypothetical protein IQ06DRAFT_376099 [Stagonospora sp. SRC1lsM3a]
MSGASRPPFTPRVLTNPHGRGDSSARPHVNSPSSERQPIPHSSTKEGMNPHKRPFDPRSRGNSPPTKRTHISRRNSGIVDKTPTGTNPGGLDQGGAPHSSLLPKASNAQSPTGEDSGGSTPTQAAPVVPNMVVPAMTLASLRSLKQQKEAISKAATVQGGQVDSLTPQIQKLEHRLSVQNELIVDMSRQITTLRLQVDPSAVQAYSETLKSVETRIVELEKQKDLSSRVEQLEKAVKCHTAELATLAGLKAPIEELKQSTSAIEQDINDNKTRLQQDRSEVQALNKDVHTLSRGFKLLDDFKKEQAKINIASRVGILSREVEKISDDLEKVIKNEEKTYDIARDIEDSNKTLVERVAKCATKLDRLEKIQSESRDQEQFSISLEKVQAEQSVLSQQQGEITTALGRLEKLQGEQNKRLEQQEMVAPVVGEVQKCQSDQAQSFERIAHLEQQLAVTDSGGPTSIVKQLNDKINALTLRTSQIEQQYKADDLRIEKLDDVSTQLDQIKDRLQDFESKIETVAVPTPQIVITPQAQPQSNTSHISDLELRVTEGMEQIKKLQQAVQSSDLERDRDLEEYAKMVRAEIRELSNRESLEETKNQIQASLVQLQNTTADEAALHEREILEIRTQHKQEMLEIRNQLAEKDAALNQLRAIFQGLQDQYNNITTDDLHGKMVHWFMETYPSNTAQALQQLAVLQHDIRSLQSTSRDTTWLLSKIQDLSSLIELGPQLSALAQNAAKLDAAIKNANEAKTKADAVESVVGKNGMNVQVLQDVIRETQQTIRDLQSDSASFIKHLDIAHIKEDLENTIQRLHNPINKKENADLDSSNRLAADAQALVIELYRAIGHLQSTAFSISQCLPLTSEGTRPVEVVFPSELDFREPAQQRGDTSSERSPVGVRRGLNRANKGKARQQ